MDPAIILLLLRLLSAALLLAFLGLIAWLIYQDLRLTTAAVADQARQLGRLRVVSSEVDGLQPDAVYPLRVVTSIGRANSNTVVLEDSYASSEHALITRRGEVWWLEDLGSRNGLLLNGFPVDEATAVSSGDIITIGSTKLKIEL